MFAGPVFLSRNQIAASRHSAGKARFMNDSLATSNGVSVVLADLNRVDHQQAVYAMTHAYACDPMGNGGALPDDVMSRLIDGLRAHPTTVILLAYVDGQPAGIATCFIGFSTFLGKPLINIHDLSVIPEHRGRGIGQTLLQAVETEARKRGCGRITLEVQQSNVRAQKIYQAFGFGPPGYIETGSQAYFYVKPLT